MNHSAIGHVSTIRLPDTSSNRMPMPTAAAFQCWWISFQNTKQKVQISKVLHFENISLIFQWIWISGIWYSDPPCISNGLSHSSDFIAELRLAAGRILQSRAQIRKSYTRPINNHIIVVHNEIMEMHIYWIISKQNRAEKTLKYIWNLRKSTSICCVFRPDFGCCALFFSSFSACSFSAIFNLFCSWFQMWNHWKRLEMNKKRLKTAEKSVSTSFLVCAAPESWSKYTTIIKCNMIFWNLGTLIKCREYLEHFSVSLSRLVQSHFKQI